MHKIDGLNYTLKKFVEKNYRNNTTRKSYKKHCKKFVEFTQHQGITARDVREKPVEYIQCYADQLIAQKKSANTVHTYVAPVCAALGVNMSEIIKPIRHSTQVIKGAPYTNPQGKHEREKDQFKSSVMLSDMIGIRRNELKKLCCNDLEYDESGYLCINVKKGKGGKPQLQRILPQYIEDVNKYFDGSDVRVFDDIQLQNKIDYHLGRREIAREAYEYYLAICLNPKESEKLREELIARYKANNNKYRKALNNNNHKEAERKLSKFIESLEGEYILRGMVRETAIERGMPVRYNNLAMMAVSVFHLSHWRNDVTIQHYILGWGSHRKDSCEE